MALCSSRVKELESRDRDSGLDPGQQPLKPVRMILSLLVLLPSYY